DFYEIHYDQDYARQMGLPGVILHGLLKAAHLAQLVTSWAGERAVLRTFDVSYRGMDVPGRPCRCRGVVKSVENGTAELGLGTEGSERRITFGEFDERSDRVAEVLQRRGVRPGDRVMVQLPRVPAWWEVLLGCFKAGAVAVPGTVLLTPRDVQYRTGLAGG